MKNWLRIGIIGLVLALIIFNIEQNNNQENLKEKKPNIEYGILTDTFVVKKGVTQKNQVLGEIT